MKGQIRNMQVVAREIAANRAKTKKFAVRSLRKDGKVSKAAVHPLNLTNTIEQAETRKAMLESMNPGSSFVIVEI